MKKTRIARRTHRLLLVASCIALVAGLAIGGTVAWLVDTDDPVVNTFTPSNIGVVLEETKPTDKTAQMVPGATIDKDPKVTVNSPDVNAWAFVKINKSTNLDSFIAYNIAGGWKTIEGEENVYYRYVDKGEAQTFSVLAGDKVTVKNTVTKEQMSGEGYTDPTMEFQAYVIQADNLVNIAGEPLVEANIAAIWALASGN